MWRHAQWLEHAWTDEEEEVKVERLVKGEEINCPQLVVVESSQNHVSQTDTSSSSSSSIRKNPVEVRTHEIEQSYILRNIPFIETLAFQVQIYIFHQKWSRNTKNDPTLENTFQGKKSDSERLHVNTGQSTFGLVKTHPTSNIFQVLRCLYIALLKVRKPSQ